MTENDGKKQAWRDKYRFSIINDATFEEVWRVCLTRYSAFIVVSMTILFIIGLTSALIAFTNLREFIPGYPDMSMRRNILLNAIRLDSLDYELALRDKYLFNISAIVQGKAPTEIIAKQDSSRDYSTIRFANSAVDSALRAKVEKDEQFNLTLDLSYNEVVTGLSGLHFFPPVKGVVSSHYDIRAKHFGTDIVTKPKVVVSVALDGVVTFTGWTMETGYNIIVQHLNDVVTIYKHNASLLKETGDIVRTGEPIGVVGDSGEIYTSGPHLHFEIWYKGTPLDPEKHVLF